MAKRSARPQAVDASTSDAQTQPKTARKPARSRASAATEPAVADDASGVARRPGPAEPMATEADIRHRAYLRYLERGGDHGADIDDWIDAERELRKR